VGIHLAAEGLQIKGLFLRCHFSSISQRFGSAGTMPHCYNGSRSEKEGGSSMAASMLSLS
jgi:hypothetical protein